MSVTQIHAYAYYLISIHIFIDSSNIIYHYSNSIHTWIYPTQLRTRGREAMKLWMLAFLATSITSSMVGVLVLSP